MKRHRHTPEQIIRKLAEGEQLRRVCGLGVGVAPKHRTSRRDCPRFCGPVLCARIVDSSVQIAEYALAG
jgi:hypothetical protein